MRRIASLAMVALAVLTIGTTGIAATRTLDLRRDAGIKLLGGCGLIRPAGDANGDDRPDVVVRGCGNEGQAMVVLFGPLAGPVDINDPPSGGYVIKGSIPEAQLASVGAADVNGDGHDDTLVGYPGADNGRGRVYVVFGKTSNEEVRLSSFDDNMQGEQGFRIEGDGLAGHYLAGSRDMNGDGREEIIVGAPFAGATYVVFGKDDFLPVDLGLFDLGAQGDRGFVIDTPGPDSSSGYSVGAAGDVNGDGIPDVVVGVIPKTNRSSGSAYVVFGKNSPTRVDVENEPFRGFKIKGAQRLDALGKSVDGAGDVNGDGRDDVIIGAPQENYHGRGHAYVVFGKRNRERVRVERLGDQGFKITGRRDDTPEDGWESAGESVAGGRDINGDGRDDVIVGAIWSHYRGREAAGATYVVYGKRSTRTIKLGNLGSHGYRIVGESSGDTTGGHVDGGVDINRDSIPDVLIGRSPYSGDPYVVWGRRWN